MSVTPLLTEPGAPEARRLFRRRTVYAALTLATSAGLLVMMAMALGKPFGVLDGIMLACFAVTVPWTVIGFWNAFIGLTLMTFSRDPVTAVAPFARSGDAEGPIASRVAFLACIRNEDPAPLAGRIAAMLDDLIASGSADRFHLYILSDSSFPEVVRAEAEMAERLTRAYAGRLPVTYRRREKNTGYKAGNVRDFCERWGREHDLALIVDADSLMSAPAMLRVLRIMERNPGIGVLQTLVTGMPTGSAFARIFQFGMRLGMRSYTLGSAWWQGDCGPYWGHNAVLRLAPFIEHCHLPLLPGKPPLGGHILSHDQVEAVQMRRAGYEVRVLPAEGDSFEQNPPTLLEFLRRDLRWCQGNMQYWRLLALPGLRPMSRIQLALAIQMYLGSPAWMGFLLLGVARATLPFLPPMHFDPEIGPAMFFVVLFMTFAPKIATAIDVFLRTGLRRGFGGGFRFAANLVSEILFSALLAPVVALANTIFMTGLVFGRTIGWTAQRRDDHAVSLLDATRRLWPQTALGILLGVIAWRGGYFLISLPMTLGFAIAIPFAIATSLPSLGRVFILLGLGRIPEETHAPPILHSLGLPALAGRLRPAGTRDPALDAAD